MKLVKIVMSFILFTYCLIGMVIGINKTHVFIWACVLILSFISFTFCWIIYNIFTTKVKESQLGVYFKRIQETAYKTTLLSMLLTALTFVAWKMPFEQFLKSLH